MLIAMVGTTSSVPVSSAPQGVVAEPFSPNSRAGQGAARYAAPAFLPPFQSGGYIVLAAHAELTARHFFPTIFVAPKQTRLAASQFPIKGKNEKRKTVF
jgi:hypothetical protein